MEFFEFPEVNANIGEGQPEYRPIPAHVERVLMQDPKGKEGDMIPVFHEVTCCFYFTEEERKQIAETGQLWYRQTTFGKPFQPIFVSPLSPFDRPDQWPK
jgi:hypothetical protein